MLALLKYADARLGEPSTWASISMLLGMAHVSVDPGVLHLITLWAAVASACFGAMLSEIGSKPGAQVAADGLAALVAAVKAMPTDVAKPVAVLVLLCVGGLLSGCAGTLPTVKIDATTGVATVAPPAAPAAKPSSLQDVAKQIATVFTEDDAAAVNMACGKPAVDSIGCNFYSDLANLSDSLAGTGSPNVKGLLTLAETARLALASGTGAPNKLLIQTYTDGVIWLADTRAKAIAVPAAVTGLLAQINATLLVPAL